MDELMSILYYWDVCPALRHSHLREVEQETQPPIRGVPLGDPHTVLRQSGVMLPELSQVAVSQRATPFSIYPETDMNKLQILMTMNGTGKGS